MLFPKGLVTLAAVLGVPNVEGHASDKQQQPLAPKSSSTPIGRPRPNIVFILTDDQDLHMDSLNYMPFVQKHLVDHGTSYKSHYTTTAVCCPARVSILTGKVAHNTNVTDVFPPFGGYPKFVREGHNENYLPIWLQSGGYKTYYAGKLFNHHTVTNYDSPHAAGWTGSEFLLDPYVYMYNNATFQRNKDEPVSHEGEYVTDVLAEKTQGFLNDAIASESPFFLGVASSAPHSNVDASFLVGLPNGPRTWSMKMTMPIPAKRHASLFHDAVVPRKANFNPAPPTGASWLRYQAQLSQENIDWNDEFYRNRLRALQAVDELVDGVVQKLEQAGILNNTYIVFTTDNGFHISQHRMQPGKECGYEEDINIPLIIRGPGVPEGAVSEAVTTHADLSPTFLSLIGVPLRADFDGTVIPLSAKEQNEARYTRQEHVGVEYWGYVGSEGKYGYTDDAGQSEHGFYNNTYKSVRIIGPGYNLYYAVWCNGEHELYDLKTDPGQLKNILHPEETNVPTTLLGRPLVSVVARLDSLMLVTKSCKGLVCSHPWRSLHPQGNVETLGAALSSQYDEFYLAKQPRVSFGWCSPGYLIEAEGPQFEKDGVAFWENWSHFV